MDDMQKAEIKLQICKRMQILMDSYEEGDIKTIQEKLYADDSVIMRPGITFLRYDGIPGFLKHLWKEGVRHIFMQNDDMLIREDIVTERSHFILTMEDGMVYQTGKALTVWVKRDDQWYIYNDMWNEGYEKDELPVKHKGD